MKLRQDINEHAKQYAEPELTVAVQDEQQRTKVGKKRSKAAHNAEGVEEAELKKWRIEDKGLCRKYKKRHRKDLTPEEIDEIIRVASEPFALHKVIAQRFHITQQLVFCLV